MRPSLPAALAVLLAACAPTPTSQPVPTFDIPTESAASGYPPAACTAVTQPPAGGDYLAGLPFESISAADWQAGPADAFITILEYSDFECIFCAELSQVLSELRA